ncbi:MAG: cyclic-di-AMP receptor [Candidatus Dormibacteraeota bacterium]|nr:cyclic-di-AMP receptor [Candidatus Dormibacteraeota bacterium]
MKLIFAIVQGEDAGPTVQALNANGVSVTRFASSGGFLQQGNVTLLIGVDAERVDLVMRLIHENCRQRNRYLTPMPPMVEAGEMFMPYPVEVQVGGATVFVVDVESYERL